MGRRAHVGLDDPLAPPRARLRRAHRLFRSHDPRRSWKRPAQANSSRIGVFKRTLSGQPIQMEGETTIDAAVRFAPALDGGVLPIQGPPGAGKTHSGAAMVCALVAAGKTVGVPANSH